MLQGKENLPAKGSGPCIFITNHSSLLDPSLCAWVLPYNFKCTFKYDLLFVPGLACLWMAGHLPVNRKIKTVEEGWFSGKWVMSMNETWLKRGAYILNYPEGTRKSSGEGGRLGAFKPGPFALSQRCQKPVIPISLSGARSIFPHGWPQLKFGEVVITVHKALPPPSSEGTLDQTQAAVTAQMTAARSAIDSGLRPVDDIPVKAEAQKIK